MNGMTIGNAFAGPEIVKKAPKSFMERMGYMPSGTSVTDRTKCNCSRCRRRSKCWHHVTQEPYYCGAYAAIGNG